ncbi:hypothetical protein ES703_30708 [subsurface metagenome]
MRKPPMTAAQRGRGTGMGKIKTLNLGVSMVRVPPRAKTAPEAPIAVEEGDPRILIKMSPSIPPQNVKSI